MLVQFTPSVCCGTDLSTHSSCPWHRPLNVFLEKQKEKQRINQNSRDELLLFDDALSTYAAFKGRRRWVGRVGNCPPKFWQIN